MIHFWYKGEPVTSTEIAKKLLELYIPYTNDKDYKFPVSVPRVGESPQRFQPASNIESLWFYNKDKTVRIWNKWMGDIQVRSSDNKWRFIKPFWSGKTFRVNIKKPSEPDKRTSISLMQFVAIKYGLATRDIKCVPADGDETNLNFDNIFPVKYETEDKRNA